MNLKNGYKSLYEIIENTKRIFKASKTNRFEDAEEIGELDVSNVKLVYEKGGKIYASSEKVPTPDDVVVTAFDAVIKEAENDYEDITGEGEALEEEDDIDPVPVAIEPENVPQGINDDEDDEISDLE